METNHEDLNFEVLGHKVRFRPGDPQAEFAARAVQRVNQEVKNLINASPQMGQQQVILLTALKLALESVGLEKEYQESLSKFQTTAEDCLRLVEEISPKTH